MALDKIGEHSIKINVNGNERENTTIDDDATFNITESHNVNIDIEGASDIYTNITDDYYQSVSPTFNPSIYVNGDYNTSKTINHGDNIYLNLAPEDVADTVDLNYSDSQQSGRFESINTSVPPNSGLYVTEIDYYVYGKGYNSGSGDGSASVSFEVYAPDGTLLFEDTDSEDRYSSSRASVGGTEYFGQRIDRCDISSSASGDISSTQRCSYDVTLTSLDL